MRSVDIPEVKVKSVKKLGRRKVYDIVMNQNHNFMLSNGILTHNTFPAQTMLRNVMETYSAKSRFIFSANYSDKIIDAVKSRCQVIEFKPVDEKEQIRLLRSVLDKEKVSYEDDDLLKLIDDCKGDLRMVINEAQRMTNKNKFVYSKLESGLSITELWDTMREKDWVTLRGKLEDTQFDSLQVLHSLFDYCSENLNVEMAVEVIGEYLWRDSLVVDKRLNVFCCLVELSKYVR